MNDDELFCPRCGATKIWKAGKRKNKDGELVRRYQCSECNRQFRSDTMRLFCEQCGKEIHDFKSGNKKYCDDCRRLIHNARQRIYFHSDAGQATKRRFLERHPHYKRDWWREKAKDPEFLKKHREKQRRWREERNGASELSPHLFRKNGKPCFERECKIVQREKNNFLRYGYRRNIKDKVRWAERKLAKCKLEHEKIRLMAPSAQKNFEDICEHCFYADFPNGIDEKGICMMGKKPYIWNTSHMCYWMKEKPSTVCQLEE